MEGEIKEIMAANRKTITLLEELLSDCPDKAEGKLLEKALRELKHGQEFICSAKMWKSDGLDLRVQQKRESKF